VVYLEKLIQLETVIKTIVRDPAPKSGDWP